MSLNTCVYTVEGFCDLTQLNSPLKPFSTQGYLKILFTTNVLKSIQVGNQVSVRNGIYVTPKKAQLKANELEPNNSQ
ncbi:hypothetical protein A4A49_05455 [Nicotiana attenuata]|uniref:Uncharacterized protein n=1 Tax=Nicotiana attenuata TaxID=49451 RepID=A0A314L9Y0_NICAT|nr:hypothetical protein A4A49_05455 [Nicotiana attenuata]